MASWFFSNIERTTIPGVSGALPVPGIPDVSISFFWASNLSLRRVAQPTLKAFR